ncbi:MAG: CoA ester lyase [Euzebyales bacterium]|nr:CoA ester lyase [Euzebyales bacterium]
MADGQPAFLRSLLFAPANHPRRVERVADFGADVVVLDLEDAVADAEKVSARGAVPPALRRYGDVLAGVRVNALSTGMTFADLDAVVCPELDLVVLPKVDAAEHLRLVDLHLARLERRQGMVTGAVRVVPLVETARGLIDVDAIAARAPARTLSLMFGIGDYTVDLGIDPTPTGEELLYARTRIAVACRAAGLPAPLDGPFLHLDDDAGLLADTRRARSLGYQGRLVLHPKQVDIVHRGFSAVDAAELRRNRDIVGAFEAAEAAGLASIQVHGHFVDYPIYRRAREVVARHEHDERGRPQEDADA